MSLEYSKPQPLNFPRGAELACRVIRQILTHNPAPGSLFNVNIPSLEKGPIEGIRVVPQNFIPYRESYDRRIDPRGRVYFWNNPEFECPDPHPDTDVSVLADRFITVTPLQFNMTHHSMLEEMNDWEWKLE